MNRSQIPDRNGSEVDTPYSLLLFGFNDYSAKRNLDQMKKAGPNDPAFISLN